MKKSLFATIFSLLVSCASPPPAHLTIGDQTDEQCPARSFSIFAIDGDYNDPWKQYPNGGVIEVKPGHHEIWYFCLPFAEKADGECLYEGSRTFEKAKLEFKSNTSYKIDCTQEGTLVFEKQS